jgi:hypothetical protein
MHIVLIYNSRQKCASHFISCRRKLPRINYKKDTQSAQICVSFLLFYLLGRAQGTCHWILVTWLGEPDNTALPFSRFSLPRRTFLKRYEICTFANLLCMYLYRSDNNLCCSEVTFYFLSSQMLFNNIAILRYAISRIKGSKMREMFCISFQNN